MHSIVPGGRDLRVAGVPLRVSPLFVVVAVLVAWHATRDVGHASVASGTPALPMPNDPAALAAWLDAQTSFDHALTHPSLAWALAAGVGVALVYTLSVLAHELGHLFAARSVGVEVSAVELDFAGGFVEIDDDDRLTAGRLALIVAAGPFVTAGITLATLIALRLLDSPADETSHIETSAAIVIDRVLSSALLLNAVALAVNLLPFRPLDGGQLLAAARLRLARG